MARTRIAWATDSWNPVTGCRRKSEGCANCYARAMATRLKGRCGYPKVNPFQVMFHPDRLTEPFKWRKPRRVFVCSMGDFFYPAYSNEWREKIYDVIERCPKHLFMILTKRPEEICACLNVPALSRYRGLRNVAYGTSIESERYVERLFPLFSVPAAFHFVSLEPLLGPVSIREYGHRLNWVIAGAESGPRPRPAKLNWFRAIRNECIEFDIPFFLKQIQTGPSMKILREPELDGKQWLEYPYWTESMGVTDL